jgi:hypothetical protein
MAKAIKSDMGLLKYFNNHEIALTVQKNLLSPGNDAQVQYILSYIDEISLQNVVTIDNNVLNSLCYTHQSQIRNSKDVISIFSNIIMNMGAKQLVNNPKDFFKFVLEAFEQFKSEKDTIITEVYYQDDVITIDIVYLLNCLELLSCLNNDVNRDTLIANLSVDKIDRLEVILKFFYD